MTTSPRRNSVRRNRYGRMFESDCRGGRCFEDDDDDLMDECDEDMDECFEDDEFADEEFECCGKNCKGKRCIGNECDEDEIVDEISMDEIQELTDCYRGRHYNESRRYNGKMMPLSEAMRSSRRYRRF